jgi:hypothetical protein
MDRELELSEVVPPQISEVNDPQVPLYNCISGFAKLDPKLLMVTL